MQTNPSTAQAPPGSSATLPAQSAQQEVSVPGRISVIMPVYNSERYLAESVDSALSQTGCDVEIILVDDGSSDSSPEIIAGYGDRVRSIVQTNAGCAAARARGIAESTGEWIAFLDNDDVWVPGKLQKQLAAAVKTNADVVYTNSRNFGELDRVAAMRSVPSAMPAGDVFEALLLDNFITTSALMVKKSCVSAAGGFRHNLAGTDDWDLWLRIAADGALFKAIPEALTLYRWRSDSLSKDFGMMHRNRAATLTKALETPRGRSVSAATKRQAWTNLLDTSAWFAHEKDKLQSARWYAQSLLRSPLRLNPWKQLVKLCLGRD